MVCNSFSYSLCVLWVAHSDSLTCIAVLQESRRCASNVRICMSWSRTTPDRRSVGPALLSLGLHMDVTSTPVTAAMMAGQFSYCWYSLHTDASLPCFLQKLADRVIFKLPDQMPALELRILSHRSPLSGHQSYLCRRPMWPPPGCPACASCARGGHVVVCIVSTLGNIIAHPSEIKAHSKYSRHKGQNKT